MKKVLVNRADLLTGREYQTLSFAIHTYLGAMLECHPGNKAYAKDLGQRIRVIERKLKKQRWL